MGAELTELMDGLLSGMVCHWLRRNKDGDLVSEQQLQSNGAGLPFTQHPCSFSGIST